MKWTVINDLHIGVNRTGGTTAESASKLRQFALDRYAELLGLGQRIIINGDMFDAYNIPLSDLLQAYQITAEWLLDDSEAFHSLHLIPGNHDLSKNSMNLGSFQLLAHLLMARFPNRVFYLPGANWVSEGDGIYAISHVANQELFELALSNVPDNVKVLLLHCNFDNVFAGQSDHSLNLSRDQAKALTKRGITIVMGHEHQGRTLMNDKVIIVGNQSPTSVSDCLVHGDGQKDGRKYALAIDGDDMELVPTWSFKDDVGGFREVDWRDLANAPDGPLFIRVSGEASASEAPSVIKAISKFRQNSKAFVITNGVKVEGVCNADTLAESVEDIRSVDVLAMLIETLDEAQAACVRKLLAEKV